jgi:hypothetical protein
MGWKPNNNAIECWLKWPKNILLSFEIWQSNLKIQSNKRNNTNDNDTYFKILYLNVMKLQKLGELMRI